MGVKLTAHEIAKLGAKYDKDLDGRIDYSEFTMAIATRTGLLDAAGVDAALVKTTKPKHSPAKSAAASSLRRAMAERIANRYTSVTKAFRDMDEDASGQLGRAEVEAALRSLGADLDDDHVREVLDRMDADGSGAISMAEFRREFAEAIHGAPQESPFLVGKHAATGRERLGQGARRQREAANAGTAAAKYENADSALRAWQSKLANRYGKVTQAFRAYDKDHSGRLTMKELHAAIRSCGIDLDQGQLRQLFNRVDASGGDDISFEEFRRVAGGAIAGEADEQGRPGGRGGAGAGAPGRLGAMEPRVEAKRDHSFQTSEFASSDAALHAFKTKLANRFSAVRKAWRTFDADHSGALSKSELKRSLASCGIGVDDATMDSVYRELDKDDDARITYAEFNKLVGSAIHGVMEGDAGIMHVPDAKELHAAKLASQAAVRAMNDVNQMAAVKYTNVEDAKRSLRNKFANKFSQVRTAWRIADKDKSNQVSVTELRRALVENGIDLAPGDMQLLFDSIDADGSGTIGYEEFRKVVGPAIHPSYDTSSGEVFPGIGPNKVLEKPTTHETATSTYQSAQAAQAAFMAKIGNKFKQVRTAFRLWDSDHNGYLTIKELQKAMASCGIAVNGDHLAELFNRFGDDGDERISYREFNQVVGGAVHGTAGQSMMRIATPKKERRPAAEHGTVQATSAEAAHEAMRNRLATNFDSVRKAFRSFDADHDGRLGCAELGEALARCGLTLSPHEMDTLLEMVDFDGSGTIEFKDFVRVFGEDIAGAQAGGKKKKAGPSVTRDDATKAMSGSFGGLEAAFRAADKDNSGSLTARELREALGKAGVRLTGPEFAAVRRLYDVDGDGLVKWREFKAQLEGEEAAADESSTAAQQAAIPHSHRPQKPLFEVPAPDPSFANEAEDKLVSEMYGGWADVVSSLRAGDRRGDGFVARRDFQQALARHNITLPKEDLRALMKKYDTRRDGTVEYAAFARGVGRLVAPNDETAGIRPRSPRFDGRPRSSRVRRGGPGSVMQPSGSVTHRGTLRKQPGPKIAGWGYERGHIVEARQESADGRLRARVAAGARISPTTHATVRTALAKHDFMNIHRAFQKIDEGRTGTVTAVEFGAVLERFGISLNDSQFKALFKAHQAQQRAGGRVRADYQSFLKAYKDVAAETLMRKQRGLTSPRRPQSSMSRRSGRGIGGRTARAQAAVSDIPGSSLEDQVAEVVKREWKGMRKVLRAFDANHDGHIDAREFHRILRHFDLPVTLDQARQLMMRYDVDDDGLLSYSEFIKGNLQKAPRAGWV